MAALQNLTLLLELHYLTAVAVAVDVAISQHILLVLLVQTQATVAMVVLQVLLPLTLVAEVEAHRTVALVVQVL
jgi:hypothetical protein